MIKKITAGLVLGSQLVFAQTVATVDGEVITDRDLLPLVGQITQGRYGTLDAQTQQRVQQMALEQSVSQILIEKEAIKSGLLKDREFNDQLELAIKHMKRQLIADMWLKKELDKQSISTAEMRGYYKANISEFQKPKQVHARHILVDSEDKAKYLIGFLSKYSGERLQKEFIDSAKKHSTGPSGKNGGDLGYFGEGVMVPEFNSAVFSMRAGEVSKAPVKTNFGYHIIYVEDTKAPETASFDEVKEMIEQKIKVEKFQKFVENKINYLKSKSNIKFH
jgi:parvulin-like peptidyl-prolyl isomerase